MKKIYVALALVLSMWSVNADAVLYTNTYGSMVLGPNDDLSTGAQNLGFTMNFFGTNYSQFYINNNGNVTFGGSTGSYSPSPLNTQTTSPMIAPYWTDLDSRYAGNVYLQQLAGQDVITWDNMGYYAQNYSGTATFQLVLNDPNNVPVGEGAFGFFYGNMTSGSDGHSATVGFGDGQAAINPGEISVATGLTSFVSLDLNGTHQWFDVNNGVPVETSPVPEPSTFILLGAGLVGIIGLRRRQNKA